MTANLAHSSIHSVHILNKVSKVNAGNHNVTRKNIYSLPNILGLPVTSDQLNMLTVKMTSQNLQYGLL